jgi:hypothetical protein
VAKPPTASPAVLIKVLLEVIVFDLDIDYGYFRLA